MTPSGNRLLPLIAVAVVVVVAAVTIGPSLHAPASRTEPPRPVRSVEADTTADTLRTVSAQLKALEQRNNALAEENERLRRNEEARSTRVDGLAVQIDRIRAGLAKENDSPEVQAMRRQLEELRTQAAQMRDSPEQLRTLNQRIVELEQRIGRLAGGRGAGGDPQPGAGTEGGTGQPGNLAGIVGSGPGGGYRPGAGAGAAPPLPAGGGGLLDPAGVMRSLGIGGAGGGSAPATAMRGPDGKPLTGLVWYGALETGGGLQPQSIESRLPWLSDPARQSAGATPLALPPAPVPHYTIPAWSTLLDATAMTALIGRISTQGTLLDPYPFKLIVGPDALAANGHMIPGLTGMVLAGTASGDWGLSCVRGTITGALFVFEDGTTLSYPQGNAVMPQAAGQGSGAAASSSGQKIELGTISDDQGNPCVVGKRVTNAGSYLADRIGIVAAGAAAQALADSQTSRTTSSGPFGTVSNSDVTGSAGQYVLGSTAQSAVGEVGKWLDERQKQSFDAIYAPSGARVAVHITKDIYIDRQPDGRRLVYPTGGSTHVRLD